MRKRRILLVSLSIGMLVGGAISLVVHLRHKSQVEWLSMAYGMGCGEPEYDHVGLLAAIDDSVKRVDETAVLLNQPNSQNGPLAIEKRVFLDSKRESLVALADLITKYFRGGHLRRIQCIGDPFLNGAVEYPSFSHVETHKRYKAVLLEYDKIRTFSWTTTIISLLGAILGPAVTMLLFFLGDRREQRRESRRIVEVGRP